MSESDEIEQLKKQIEALQKKIEQLRGEGYKLSKSEVAGGFVNKENGAVLSRTEEVIGDQWSEKKELFYCGACGRPVSSNVVRCVSCMALLHLDCSYSKNKKYLCENCLKNYHGISLTLDDVKIMYAISLGINSASSIAQVVKIYPHIIEQRIGDWVAFGLVIQEGFLFFRSYSLTSTGEEILGDYLKIYSQDLTTVTDRIRRLR